MERTYLTCSLALCLVLAVTPLSLAGDAFTGYQFDNHGQYYTYFGIRTPLPSSSSTWQPFVQVMGAGLGYTFKDQGTLRDATMQFVTPSLGLKTQQGAWTFLGFAGPQIRWKQEDRPTGGKTDEQTVGVYAQGEALWWQEEGTVHTIVSYTDLDHFIWGRIRATRLVHKSDQGCCSTYFGWDVAGMGNKDFYTIQTGPLIQIPINQFIFTIKGGYQYSQTFQSGTYGGIELYVPF